jgi:hypothetical protein
MKNAKPSASEAIPSAASLSATLLAVFGWWRAFEDVRCDPEGDEHEGAHQEQEEKAVEHPHAFSSASPACVSSRLLS